ncbi:CHAT domain-containing protein [Chloroflexia bacterium SDU3-3]|nr:CHAT domain-containing protein [Chloroflexia bacterium SDU3-3]
MERRALAEHLVSADTATRYLILAECVADIDVQLAWEIKTIYDDAKVSDARRAIACVDTLRAAANLTNSPTIAAYVRWVEGMVALHLEGQAEQSLQLLDQTIEDFKQQQLPLLASYTQFSRMHALAILGRYDEAIACGLETRTILLEQNDLISVGKIEQNLGNTYGRRGQYVEAEQFFLLARDHFIEAGQHRKIAGVESNLANILASQCRLKEAADFCEQALTRLDKNEEGEIHASIEENLGWLALLQGQYHRALDYLGRSRRLYASFGTHGSAIAELGIADTYLNLNLTYEAESIYVRAEQIFTERGMIGELANTWANHARACLAVSRLAEAHTLAQKASNAYLAEGNSVGSAEVALVSAQILYEQHEYSQAYDAAAQAEGALLATNVIGKMLLARWVRGQCATALGLPTEAEEIFTTTLTQAEQQPLPEIVRLCITSLGMLAMKVGEIDRAQTLFQRAISLIETIRAPLPTDELRSAFLLNKLTPYIELARLALGEAGTQNIELAFQTIEQARSRALLDMVGGSIQMQIQPSNVEEQQMVAKIEQLSTELGWIYSQLSLPADDGYDRLYKDAQIREMQMLDLMRQLRQGNLSKAAPYHTVSLDVFQKSLPDNTVLIEYFVINDEIIALLIDKDHTTVYRNIAQQQQIEAVVRQFHFQIDTLRYGSSRLQAHIAQLEHRTKSHLQNLYDLLLRPFTNHLNTKHIIIAPYHTLHYVPFHALHDGKQYLIERCEISYTLSATLLYRSREAWQCPDGDTLLLGASDANAPHINEELLSLHQILPNSQLLMEEAATLTNLRKYAAQSKIIHIASHGIFRPDNPLFSAIQLADGWLTVHDIYELNLQGSLVALSACETGVSFIASGDELLGLIRGFFAAGAERLLASLWVADDIATTNLMRSFYTNLINGHSPTTALRNAQLATLKEHAHPFFWASFVLIGGY